MKFHNERWPLWQSPETVLILTKLAGSCEPSNDRGFKSYSGQRHTASFFQELACKGFVPLTATPETEHHHNFPPSATAST